MSGKSSFGDAHERTSETISFAKKYIGSEQFQCLFRDGMALVEETATYLDRDGRRDARGLKSPMALAYATESMRLTTRLMQIASWLLIQRTVNNAEMTVEQGSDEKRKLKLKAIGRPGHVKNFDKAWPTNGLWCFGHAGVPSKVAAITVFGFARDGDLRQGQIGATLF